ncbi:MAG: ricin-type beta-trefoil lectin domain protein [Nostoc sp. NOS(2021)]|uniref:RICIN domain-containing protein n=1 Tax=Nostoc sp. NOS(2021) TaxID=2815407 RepID=UPI0025DFC9A7|nr:ricin-type beta-trefoil lectin domain protein [Nostoc sp. NOS(2021)]MBN3893891.1 ricin-type beta-trefoil lectin domain protein [Nostoc sp. NOS(2021)]
MKPNLKKHTAIAVGFVGSLLWGATCILENQNAIAQVGGMFIINELSNRCLDVNGDPGTVNGAPLILYDCELSGYNSSSGRITDQKWEFIRGGFIRNVLSNKCLDVNGDPGTANGAPLILYDCELSGYNSSSGRITDQKWEFIRGGFIRNVLSNKCLDVNGDPGTANGAPLILYDCELSGYNSSSGRITDQRWEYIGAGFIRNVLSNKCIDVSGDPGTANGASLILYDCELSGYNSSSGRTSDQRWRWQPSF